MEIIILNNPIFAPSVFNMNRGFICHNEQKPELYWPFMAKIIGLLRIWRSVKLTT